jgi:hypothetical protein
MASKTAEVIYGQVFNRVLETVKKDDVPVGNAAAYEVAKAVTQEVAPVVVNASNSEHWTQSRVILGALAAIIATFLGIVAQILALFGIDFTAVMQGQIALIIMASVGLFGACYALYGRIFGASKKPLRS